MLNLLLLSAEVGEHSAGPQIFGLGPVQIVSLSMLVLIAIILWKKVPAMIAGGLDAKIQLIKDQLEEAQALRNEAEALRQDYAAKIASAKKDTQALLRGAQEEADAIVAKAEADCADMIARRKKMADDKIAAAERAAIDDVRAKVVAAASGASYALIAGTHDAKADSKLADEMIAGL